MMMNGVQRKQCCDYSTYPVERLFEFNSVSLLEAYLDFFLRKTKPSEYTVRDSEPTEHLLFVIFPEFSIW